MYYEVTQVSFTICPNVPKWPPSGRIGKLIHFQEYKTIENIKKCYAHKKYKFTHSQECQNILDHLLPYIKCANRRPDKNADPMSPNTEVFSIYLPPYLPPFLPPSRMRGKMLSPVVSQGAVLHALFHPGRPQQERTLSHFPEWRTDASRLVLFIALVLRPVSSNGCKERWGTPHKYYQNELGLNPKWHPIPQYKDKSTITDSLSSPPASPSPNT